MPTNSFSYYLLPVVITIAFVTIYATAQQGYRLSANDPQIEIAEDMVSVLDSGAPPQDVIGRVRVNIASSLATFAMIVDNNGKSLASSAVLDGATPAIPSGVLDDTRQHGEDRFTWEPKSGVRIAAVVTRYNNGFILVGRSLREVEKRERQLSFLVGFPWIISLIISLSPFYLKRKKALVKS